jgi:hypothetical protein
VIKEKGDECRLLHFNFEDASDVESVLELSIALFINFGVSNSAFAAALYQEG